jgi:hypothetical protein
MGIAKMESTIEVSTWYPGICLAAEYSDGKPVVRVNLPNPIVRRSLDKIPWFSYL